MKLDEFYRGTTVAVTGAAGTVGKALVKALLGLEVRHVFALDNDEGALFELGEQLSGEPRLETFLADVADLETLRNFFSGVNHVFHAAAYKNVPVCERSPSLAVRANITGTENVIAAARANRVQRVLFTSSDKAVNPTNVMGTTKLMGERLITAANVLNQGQGTIFASTRFGNVAGSRGSVVPVFIRQIAAGGPVTLTDGRMTRFIMTLGQATRLLLESMVRARGGESFVTKMPVFRMPDVAAAMIDILAPCFGYAASDIEIIETGSRPGEKMFEELVTEEEVARTYEEGDLLAVLPAFRNIYDQIDYAAHMRSTGQILQAYHSANETPATAAAVRAFLLEVEEIAAIVEGGRKV